MAHTISIDNTAQGLNQFMVRYSAKLHSIMRQGLEWEREIPFVQADYAYSGQEVSIGNVVQPYQSAFTPVNAETYDGVDSFLRPIKVDLIYDDVQLEKFFSKWNANHFTPDPEKKKKYFQFLLDDVILPKAMEDLNNVSWKGQYVAPTPGTAGAMLDSVDGWKVNIANQITAGRLTPLATGAWPVAPTIGNGEVIDYIRAFCNLIPEPYRYAKGTLHMSKTKAQLYSDDYREKYQRGVQVPTDRAGLFLKVDDYNKTISGKTSMEGDDRIILNFDNMESMIIGTRTGYPLYFTFRFEAEDRNLKVFSEIYRFYNFETCLHMFVSDQV